MGSRRIKRPQRVRKYSSGGEPVERFHSFLDKMKVVGGIVGGVGLTAGAVAAPHIINKLGTSYWNNDDTALLAALEDTDTLRKYGLNDIENVQTGLYRRPGSFWGPKAAPAEALAEDGTIKPESDWYKGLNQHAKQNAILEQAYKREFGQGYIETFGDDINKILSPEQKARLVEQKKFIHRYEGNKDKANRARNLRDVKEWELSNSSFSTPQNTPSASPEASTDPAYGYSPIYNAADGMRIPRYELGTEEKVAIGLTSGILGAGSLMGGAIGGGLRWSPGGSYVIQGQEPTAANPIYNLTGKAKPGFYFKAGKLFGPSIKNMGVRAQYKAEYDNLDTPLNPQYKSPSLNSKDWKSSGRYAKPYWTKADDRRALDMWNERQELENKLWNKNVKKNGIINYDELVDYDHDPDADLVLNNGGSVRRYDNGGKAKWVAPVATGLGLATAVGVPYGLGARVSLGGKLDNFPGIEATKGFYTKPGSIIGPSRRSVMFQLERNNEWSPENVRRLKADKSLVHPRGVKSPIRQSQSDLRNYVEADSPLIAGQNPIITTEYNTPQQAISQDEWNYAMENLHGEELQDYMSRYKPDPFGHFADGGNVRRYDDGGDNLKRGLIAGGAGLLSAGALAGGAFGSGVRLGGGGVVPEDMQKMHGLPEKVRGGFYLKAGSLLGKKPAELESLMTNPSFGERATKEDMRAFNKLQDDNNKALERELMADLAQREATQTVMPTYAPIPVRGPDSISLPQYMDELPPPFVPYVQPIQQNQPILQNVPQPPEDSFRLPEFVRTPKQRGPKLSSKNYRKALEFKETDSPLIAGQPQFNRTETFFPQQPKPVAPPPAVPLPQQPSQPVQEGWTTPDGYPMPSQETFNRYYQRLSEKGQERRAARQEPRLNNLPDEDLPAMNAPEEDQNSHPKPKGYTMTREEFLRTANDPNGWSSQHRDDYVPRGQRKGKPEYKIDLDKLADGGYVPRYKNGGLGDSILPIALGAGSLFALNSLVSGGVPGGGPVPNAAQQQANLAKGLTPYGNKFVNPNAPLKFNGAPGQGYSVNPNGPLRGMSNSSVQPSAVMGRLFGPPGPAPTNYPAFADRGMFSAMYQGTNAARFAANDGAIIPRYEDGGGSNEGQAAAQQTGGGGGANAAGGDYDMGQWKENEKGASGGDSPGGSAPSGGAVNNSSAPSNTPTNVPAASGPISHQEAGNTTTAGAQNVPDNTPNVTGDNGTSPNNLGTSSEGQDNSNPNYKPPDPEKEGSYGSNDVGNAGTMKDNPKNLNQINNGTNAAMDFYNNNEALINILGPLAASFIPGVGPLISSAWIGAQGLSNHNMAQVATSALFLPGNIAAAGTAAKAAFGGAAAAEAGTAAAGTAAGEAAAQEGAQNATQVGANATSGAAQTATQAAQQAQSANTMMTGFENFAQRSRRLGTAIQYGNQAYDQVSDHPAAYADGGRVPRYADGVRILKTAAPIALGAAALGGATYGVGQKLGVRWGGGDTGLWAQGVHAPKEVSRGFFTAPGTVLGPTQEQFDATVQNMQKNKTGRLTSKGDLRRIARLVKEGEYEFPHARQPITPHQMNALRDSYPNNLEHVDNMYYVPDDYGFLMDPVQAEETRRRWSMDTLAYGGSVPRYAFGGGSYGGLVQATQRPMTSIGRSNAIGHKTYDRNVNVAPEHIDTLDNEELERRKKHLQEEDENEY